MQCVITFPQFAPGAPVVVSATQYVTYRRCPDQARFRALGVYGSDSRQSLRGMLAHRLFYRHLTEGTLSPDRVEAVCLEEIGERYNSRLPGLGLAKMSTLRPLIREVSDLYQRFCQTSMSGFRSAEIDLMYEPSDAVTLRGTVDAVFNGEDGVRLVDWKTGSLGDAQHQLDFYALLWTLAEGELPSSVEAASVSSGDRYVAEPTPESVQAVASSVVGLVNTVRRSVRDGGHLPQLAGPHCEWCPAVNECPEGATAVRISC